MVNNFFSPLGGAEKVVADEINLLRRAGYIVEVFSTDRQPYFENAPTLERFFPAFFDMRSGPYLQRPLQLFKAVYNVEAAKKFDAAIEEFKPDLVHLHNLHYVLTPSILDPLMGRDIPVFAHAHDIRYFCPSGNFSDSQNFDGSCISGNPLKCLKNKCKHNSYAQTAFGLLEHYLQNKRNLLHRIDHWLCPSEAVFRVMQRAGFSESKLNRLANFVDEDMLVRGPGIKDEGYLLYFGRVIVDKGLDDLIEALAMLPGVKLKIVGDGPDEHHYREKVRKFRLQGTLLDIEFIESKSKSDLMPLIENCRATVMPSRWYEPFGLTILESYAFAKPVIGTRVGAIPELIDVNKTGVLAKPADPKSLADAIGSVMGNIEHAKMMGLTGRTMLQKGYTADVHLRDLQLLYANSISNTKRNETS